MSKKRSEQGPRADPAAPTAPVLEFTDSDGQPVPAHIAADAQSKGYAPPWLKGHSLHPGVTYAPASAVTMSKEAHDGRGRPKIIIPDEMLFYAASTFASFNTLGKMFGIDENVLLMDPHYREIIERARALRKGDLLAAQFHNAINLNNPVMQIWLGKQYLEQKDKVENIQTGPDGKPIQHEHTHRAVAYIPENGRDLPQITAKVQEPAVPPTDLEELGEVEEVELDAVEEAVEGMKRKAIAHIPDNGRDQGRLRRVK